MVVLVAVACVNLASCFLPHWAELSVPEKVVTSTLQSEVRTPTVSKGASMMCALHDVDEARKEFNRLGGLTDKLLAGGLPPNMRVRVGANGVWELAFFGKESARQLQYHKDLLNSVRELIKSKQVVRISDLSKSSRKFFEEVLTTETGILPDNDVRIGAQFSITKFVKIGNDVYPLEKDLQESPTEEEISKLTFTRTNHQRLSKTDWLAYLKDRWNIGMLLKFPDVAHITNMTDFKTVNLTFKQNGEWFFEDYCERYRDVFEGWENLIKSATKEKGIEGNDQWIYDRINDSRDTLPLLGRQPQFGPGQISINPSSKAELTIRFVTIRDGKRGIRAYGMTLPKNPLPPRKETPSPGPN